MSSQNVKNLSEVTDCEFKKIVDSFDEVLCDCDGVLYFLNTPVSGVIEAVNAFRNLKKNVRFVSNNSTLTKELFTKKLNKHGMNAEATDIVYPTWAIIEYLKKINFNRTIYLFGTKAMRSELKNAGFKIAPEGPDRVEESMESLFNEIRDDEEIGAVVIDWDLNINYIRLQKALIYLSRSDVLLLYGATDEKLPLAQHLHLIGPNHFQAIFREMTTRTPLVFGKPGSHMRDYILQEFNIKNPNRILFIGDSLRQDMVFASKCGFQKLLVLTGVTHIDELKKITSNELLPDYYLSSLGDMGELIKTKYSCKY